MKHLLLAAILALTLCLAPRAASAQWVINEYVTTSVTAPRYQFVELYNPVPDQSVDGLSIISVRTFSTGNFWSRHDLSGTANGNFYLVVAEAYADDVHSLGGLPPYDEVVLDADLTGGATFWLRRTFMEILLVNTADIPVGLEPGDAFDGTEFNNGADIIDLIYARDEAREVTEEPGIFAPGDWPKFGENANPAGMFRDGDVGDGIGPWLAMTTPSGPDGTLPPEATPGSSNAGEPAQPDPVVAGIETFENLNTTDPIDGTPTLTPSAIFQTRIFGAAPPPFVEDDASTAFPQAADSRYIYWNSNVDSILEIVEADGIDGADEVYQVAFALRIDQLHATDNAFNNMDIFLLTSNTSGSSGGAQLGGLRIEDGVLRMGIGNGWNSVILSETAADGTSPDNWADDQWRVIVGQFSPSLIPGEPWTKWWVVDPATGDTELLVDVPSLLDDENNPTTTARTGTLRRIGFGAVERGAQLPWQTAVSVDQFGIFGTNDYPDEFELFTGVYNNYVDPFQRITPADGEIDFGTIDENVPETETFTVVNEGTLPVELSSSSLTGTGFELLTTLPVSVPGRSSLDLEVEFDADGAPGEYDGVLTVNTDDAGNPSIVIDLTGRAGLPTMTGPVWEHYR